MTTYASEYFIWMAFISQILFSRMRMCTSNFNMLCAVQNLHNEANTTCSLYTLSMMMFPYSLYNLADCGKVNIFFCTTLVVSLTGLQPFTSYCARVQTTSSLLAMPSYGSIQSAISQTNCFLTNQSGMSFCIKLITSLASNPILIRLQPNA